jgi:hypothetical protein
MSVKADSLWPPAFEATLDELPPLTILKQQAGLLGDLTRNLIEGEVETATEDYQRFLRHTFFLVAPALNFYRYPLLEVEHRATQVYPAKVKVTWLDKGPGATYLESEPKNEEEFKNELKKIFADSETKRIIGALLAQSKGEPRAEANLP